jgi:hypothetical protein
MPRSSHRAYQRVERAVGQRHRERGKLHRYRSPRPWQLWQLVKNLGESWGVTEAQIGVDRVATMRNG